MARPHDWRDAPLADFAVLGDPVSHSRSPKMHEAAYQALAMKRSYVPIEVKLDDLSPALSHLARLGYRGVNLTVPLKEAGAKWAEKPDEFVRRVGSANTLDLLESSATNTDAPGFLDTLPGLGIWPPSKVLVLGAGGAARALTAGLAEAGFRVRVFNRTPERAEAMVRGLGAAAEVLGEPNPEGCSLILNTTSAALSGEAPDLQWNRADRKAIAYDLTYGSELTPFLLKAALQGHKVVDGLDMLVAQGARSFEWWLGVAAPLDAMRRAVE